jgi:hypothetical protein
MPPIRVQTYGLVWSVATNKGAVNLQLANNTQGQIEVDSPEELAAIGDILRTSHDVTFDANGHVLATALKLVGTT